MGHDTEFYKTGDVQLRVDDVYFDAFHGSMSFRETDIVIPRIGRSLTDFGVLLLNHLALMDVPTTLSAAGLAAARNKFATLQKPRSAGLRIPESFLVASKIKAGDVIEQSPPPPQACGSPCPIRGLPSSGREPRPGCISSGCL